MMTAKAQRQEPDRPLLRRRDASGPDAPRDDARRPLDRAPEDAAEPDAGSSTASTTSARSAMTIADELRLAHRLPQLPRLRPRGRRARPRRLPRRPDSDAESRSRSTSCGSQVGDGITGRVRRARRVDRRRATRRNCEFGEQIAGTAAIEESLLAVPLRYGSRVVGRHRRLEARPRPVRRGRRSAARGARRPRRRRARERAPVRGAAPRGRERDGAARVRPRARDARRASTTSPSASTELSAEILGAASTSFWLQARTAASRSRRSTAIRRRWRRSSPRGTLPVERARRRSRPVHRRAADYEPEIGEAPVPGGRYASPRSTSTAAPAASSPLVERRGLRRARARLLGGLAHQAKLAIANASSYEGLERTFVSTVEALANALEANDEYTSTHARWITDLSLRVGEELGLDERDAQAPRARRAPPRHRQDRHPERHPLEARPADRGGAADRRRRIPELGERIIAPIDRLQDVRPIVRHCHERWDGARLSGRRRRRGHPARVAHHLRLRRVPRDDDRPAVPASPQPSRGACAGLREAPGTQFDPHVVEVALRVLELPAEELELGSPDEPDAASRRRCELGLAALERVGEPAERAVLP